MGSVPLDKIHLIYVKGLGNAVSLLPNASIFVGIELTLPIAALQRLLGINEAFRTTTLSVHIGRHFVDLFHMYHFFEPFSLK